MKPAFMDGGTLAGGLELINRRVLRHDWYFFILTIQCFCLAGINIFGKIIWLNWLASDRCHCQNAP